MRLVIFISFVKSSLYNLSEVNSSEVFKGKQAELGVPHSKSKLSGPNQIHLASWNLLDFFGGRTGRKD